MEAQAGGQAVVMGIWWCDRHMCNAQPGLCGHREPMQSVADGGHALPLATVQDHQASESISPGWREREAWGAVMGREAKIASFMFSRSEKLCCFLKPFLSVQLPQAFEVPFTGWSPTRGVSQELTWIRIFFLNWKKNPKCCHAKSRMFSLPCAQEFYSLCLCFLNIVCCCIRLCLLMVRLCWTPISSAAFPARQLAICALGVCSTCSRSEKKGVLLSDWKLITKYLFCSLHWLYKSCLSGWKIWLLHRPCKTITTAPNICASFFWSANLIELTSLLPVHK